MAVVEEIGGDNDEPIIEDLTEEEAAAEYSGAASAPTGPPQKKKIPERDGVALTAELIRRKAEHNDGMLHNLEEIALHQLDIDKIESLNHCRCLKIVYLQGNLIRKIENLYRLKELDYLNIAMNNITKIENLERCEALVKLDMTVNFVDLDELHSVGSLKNNTKLRHFYLVGNPCTVHWKEGYRDYVVATLPQLESLDGNDITRAERIKAMQRLTQLERELAYLAPLAAERKKEQRARWEERQRKIDSGELVVTNDTTDEWCPEVRVDDARELREIEEKKQAYRRKAQCDTGLFGDQPVRERRYFREDGTPIQMNTAKWPFSIDEDGLNVYVDIALPKFLDSAAVDADIQPTYVRVLAKKQTLQLVLPAEVLTDSSNCKRSSTTGHLLITCPKLHPVVMSKAPTKKAPPAKALEPPISAAGLLAPPTEPGSQLKGAVDIRGIVPTGPGGRAQAEAAAAMKPTLGPDFDEEDEVPPLM